MLQGYQCKHQKAVECCTFDVTVTLSLTDFSFSCQHSKQPLKTCIKNICFIICKISHLTPYQPMGKMQKFQPGAVKFKFEPVERKITGLCKMLRIKASPRLPFRFLVLKPHRGVRPVLLSRVLLHNRPLSYRMALALPYAHPPIKPFANRSSVRHCLTTLFVISEVRF